MSANPGFFDTLFYGSVGLVIIALALAAVIDWFNFHSNQPPGLAEFAKASHGAGVIALYTFLFIWPWGMAGLGDTIKALWLHPDHWANWLPVVVLAWGGGWLVTGWRRAPRFRDGRMIARTVVKVALGVGLFVYGRNHPGEVGMWFLPLDLAALWCTVTGTVKILMLMRGSSPAYPLVANDIDRNTFDWDRV